MKSLLPFDEINGFKQSLHERFAKANGKALEREEYEDIIDEMLDLFLLACARAVEVTNENLSSDWKPSLDEVMKTVDKEVAGKTWKQRVEEYSASGGTEDDLVRIVETESHRDALESALAAAKHGGATTKTWATMLDDRVRDTHFYLEGVTIAIEDDFYTDDGDYAPAPGLFQLPENNVNCRCELLFE